MKKIGALLSIGILLSVYSNAQDDRGMKGGDQKGRFYGKIVDALTNKGIEAASVQIFVLPGKGGTGNVSDLPAGGMLTAPNGDFSIDNLPANDSFKLVVSAIGFEEKSLLIAFPARRKNATTEMSSLDKDLGNIALAQDAQYLNSVTVVGQKPGLEMGIDRKIFNVEKNITATGGTAVDVMKNIPSVTVDVDGNVLLRNASPKIFVDGLPTILTLDQIPADNIERIELITNPSAKFDAASSAGIINVILKKNKRKGFNGIASAGIGSPDITTGSLSLNHREGKINFF
ncbi:MAG TPA: TonB-dependent receptor plug domain-containing protein, partial [Chitinophagaceae bacterium]|nr:TonB-dependent receptor plug domain-containing protein [Chitinophagaceae bacterium]